jgi:hypothetical protein
MIKLSPDMTKTVLFAYPHPFLEHGRHAVQPKISLYASKEVLADERRRALAPLMIRRHFRQLGCL